MKLVVGITGASGSIYALRLIEVLRQAGHEVHAVVTDSGWIRWILRALWCFRMWCRTLFRKSVISPPIIL